MPNGHNFQHLPLILRESGAAKLTGGGSVADQTLNNRTNRGAHSANLQSSTSTVVSQRQATIAQRATESLPDLPPGIPLLLEVDPGLDIDLLRHHYNFEIVSEEEGGFVIVASANIDLTDFLNAVTAFASSAHGTATIASVHRLDDDPDQNQRLRLILSERLFGLWPNVDDNANYVVDIGVTCLGTREIPPVPKRGKRDTDATWARKQSDWANERTEAYDAWYDIQEQRINEVRRIIVDGYNGSIGQIYHTDPVDAVTLPDSFTMRVEVSGQGLKDFVLNFPFVFEVVEPDDITLPDLDSEAGVDAEKYPTPQPPEDDAPAVCVIDSGIQEEHLLRMQAFGIISTQAEHIPHSCLSLRLASRIRRKVFKLSLWTPSHTISTSQRAGGASLIRKHNRQVLAGRGSESGMSSNPKLLNSAGTC